MFCLVARRVNPPYSPTLPTPLVVRPLKKKLFYVCLPLLAFECRNDVKQLNKRDLRTAASKKRNRRNKQKRRDFADKIKIRFRYNLKQFKLDIREHANKNIIKLGPPTIFTQKKYIVHDIFFLRKNLV